MGTYKFDLEGKRKRRYKKRKSKLNYLQWQSGRWCCHQQNVPTSSDDGVGSAITHKHDVSLLLWHFHVLSVHSCFYLNNISLTTLVRSSSHRSRHRVEVTGAVSRHHHVRSDRTRLQKAPFSGGDPLRPLDAMINIPQLHEFLPVVAVVVMRHVSVSEIVCHGQCVAAQVLYVYLAFLKMAANCFVSVVVRETVEASLLVGYGGTDESFEVLRKSLGVGGGRVVFEVIHGLVKLIKGLVDGFQAVVESRFLPRGE